MKRQFIGVTILLALGHYAQAVPSSGERTPLEAISYALELGKTLLPDYRNEYVDDAYEERFSEFLVFYNYESTKRYYVFFSYWGSGEVPTWDELEGCGSNNNKPPGSILVYFIPASRVNQNFAFSDYTVVDYLFKREQADVYLSMVFRDSPKTYIRTVIEDEGPCPMVYFLYMVGGKSVLVNNSWGMRLPDNPNEIEEPWGVSNNLLIN